METTELVILSDSKFVCDSLMLAERLGVQHKNLLESLRRAAKAAKADCIELQYKPVEYTDDHGQSRPKFDLTFDHLITASMYIEKLKPKFREYIKAVMDTRAKQASQLQAENQKLLNSPERVETEFGVKYVKNIPTNKKTVPWFDVTTGKRRFVLASSLSFDDLADILISQAEPKARGIVAASHALRAWSQAAKAAKAHRKPIPTLNDFGVKTSFEENLLEALNQD